MTLRGLPTISSFDGYVRFLSRYFYVDGLEPDDLEQEARLAAWLAPAGLERIAARRRVLDLLKASRRMKRGVAVEFVTEPASSVDVFAVVSARETLRGVLEGKLSPSEAEALGRLVRDEPIRRGEKRLESALYRFRQRHAQGTS
jgi:hypothetical protein